MKSIALLGALFFLLWGCGNDQRAGSALVQVGEVEIDAAALRQYKAKLPTSMQSHQVGEDAVRDLLQSLVDRKIMLLEARDKGLDLQPRVQARLSQFQQRTLIDSLVSQKVNPVLRVSEEEVYEIFKRDHWDQEHWPAHILSATEEEAWEVVRSLKEGADFSTLARRRSIAPDADRGGDLGGFFSPGDAATPIINAVVGLPAGAFTDPVKTRDGYEVIKVLDVRPVPFAQVRGRLEQGLVRQKAVQARFALLEDLEVKHGVEYHREGVNALLKMAKSGEFPGAEEEQLPLLSYGDGRTIAAGAGARMLADKGKPLETIRDTAEVIRSLRARVMADTLVLIEARAQGLDKAQAFLDLVDTHLERLIVDYLYKTEILDKVEVTEEEVLQQYESKKDQYTVPGHADVVEILVADEEQARDLVAQIGAGEDMVTLARRHTQRPGMRSSGGVFSVREGDQRLGARFLERVFSAAVGEMVGPLAVEGGFSLFKVESRHADSLQPLEKVRAVLERSVQRRKADAAFEPYLGELRRRYASQIQWNDQRIEELAASGEW